ncbi:MAG: MraY family glycosyltransferase [Bacteroidetes bacterium]|nr:MraY family glycosyltransferase [Bacteroidota bacterium]
MFHLTTMDLRILLCFSFAGGITFFLIPSIVEMAAKKHLVAEPGSRTSHEKSVPNLGGIAIFIGFIISYLLFLKTAYFPTFQFLLAGTLMLFFVGFKDDITHISPFKKFFGQVVAAWIVVSFGGIRITSLYGFFGIYEIQEPLSYMISMITVIGITNCFNLMDGIDGLSAGLAILASFTFGTWFYLAGDYDWVILAAGLAGSLFTFSYFNVFGRSNKIFMGDTGSLTVGFIMSVIAIHFNQVNLNPTIPNHIHAAPAVSIGILMLPIFDTLRVMIFRLARRKSPFDPDKTHIHHHLLDLGLSHLQATLVLLGISLIFIFTSFLCRNLSVFICLVILFSMGIFKMLITVYLARRKLKKRSAFPNA